MLQDHRRHIAWLLRNRALLFLGLAVCALWGPLAASVLLPEAWGKDPSLGGHIFQILFYGGFAFAPFYFTYGCFYNWRLRRRADQIPLHSVTGLARKEVRHYRAPIPVGGTTMLGSQAFTMCQFLVIDRVRYAVPLYTPFDPIPTDRPVRLTFVDLGGPLFRRLRRIVLAWEAA
ncbi:MAG: hypothetical protein HY543_08175 [Deltaproteobacteria bacterium]|nr:hypothetical protein [Deltaproteobacteria bacterium]